MKSVFITLFIIYTFRETESVVIQETSQRVKALVSCGQGQDHWSNKHHHIYSSCQGSLKIKNSNSQVDDIQILTRGKIRQEIKQLVVSKHADN